VSPSAVTAAAADVVVVVERELFYWRLLGAEREREACRRLETILESRR